MLHHLTHGHFHTGDTREQKRIEFVERRMPSTADAALIVNTLLDDNDWCSHVCPLRLEQERHVCLFHKTNTIFSEV